MVARCSWSLLLTTEVGIAECTWVGPRMSIGIPESGSNLDAISKQMSLVQWIGCVATTAVVIFESSSCSSVLLWPAGRCPCYVAQSQKPTPAYAVIQGFICKGSSYSMQTTCQAQKDEAILISVSAMCRPRYLARLPALSYLRKEAGKYGRHNAAAARHSVQRVTVSATRFRPPQETTGLSVARNACG